MKFIRDFRDSEVVRDIYFCKQKVFAETKNGKTYISLLLQDKTGTIDAKVWEPYSPGIRDFEALDYIEVHGKVTTFAGALQLSVDQIYKMEEGEYEPANYFPCTDKDTEVMYGELLDFVSSVKTPCLKTLLTKVFVEDKDFVERFKKHSAAKAMHHGFIGGLLEHTLSVTKLCDFYATQYKLLNRDLLLTAAMLHDMGKIYELSAFPTNDYTDEGQLLGHIVIGSEKITELSRDIENFPVKLLNELKHCILAHHGEYEFGSPKKPAIAEAVALNFADNTDAKMEMFKEIFAGVPMENNDWLGYNRLFESNVRRTTPME